MAFTTGNDINVLSASDSATVGAGAGNDRYILSPGQALGANQVINITDTQGTNTLQLIGGLTIASSIVSANAIQLKLSNGATINVFGADSFSFEIGGDPLLGTPGTIQNFSSFVTTSLGLASVPTTGTAAGTPNVNVNSNGTVTPTAPAGSYVLTATSPTVTEGNTGTATLTYTVTLNKAATEAVTVNVAASGTATSGTDYTANIPSTLTFAVGETSKTITVTVNGDLVDEANETVVLTFTGTKLAAPVVATGTITNDDAPATFALTAAADSINEGVANVFTVTASKPVTVDTVVTFQLRIDGSGDTAQAADFNAGSFNPVTVTILAGQTTATFNLSTITNDGTELSEKYTVQATVGGNTLTKQVTILDGSLGAGQTFTLTKELDILPGMKGSNDNTVTSGNDTVIGVIELGGAGVATTSSTLNAVDLINAGQGTDTLKAVIAGTSTGGDYTLPTNFEGVEVLEVQSSLVIDTATKALLVNTTAVSGLTDVNVTKSADLLKVTAAATTNVNVGIKASANDTMVDGGKNISVKITDAAANTDTIGVGTVTAAKGTVTVDVTGTAVVAGGNITLGQIDVKGGTTISVTEKASGDVSAVAAGAATTYTQGAVNVTGDALTTSVTVKQDAAATAVAATAKSGGVTETTTVKFAALTANQTLTLAGLTFTAKVNMTAAEVAAAFSNLVKTTVGFTGDPQGSGLASKGVYTANSTGWTSGAATGDTVVFTSSTANSNVTDLSTTVGGTGTAPTFVSTTQGKANDAGFAGGVLGVVSGTVAITDASATIKTITVDGYGASSSTTGTTVLDTLNLSNSKAAFTAAASASTLNLNLEKIGAAGANAAIGITAAPTTLNVKSVGANFANLTAAATTTLNVSGTGTLNTSGGTFGALNTVKVSETAGLTLAAAAASTLTSVDTTATTGTVTSTINGVNASYAGGAGVDNVTVTTGTALTKSIKLGAGDDTLTFGVAVTGSAIVLDGGDGTDTLSMTTANADALDVGIQTFYTGFERLSLSDAGAAATINLANLGFTNYVTTNGSAGVLQLDNLLSNGTVALAAAPTTGTVVNVANALTGTADVLNIEAQISGDIDFKSFTAAKVETINLKVVDSTPTTINTATLALVANGATKIVASGNGNLTLDNTGNFLVSEIDGSALTGALKVTAAGSVATTITGGAGNDFLTASTGTLGAINATGASASIKNDGSAGSTAGVNGIKETQTLTITADGTDNNDETLTVSYGTNTGASTASVLVTLDGTVDVTNTTAVATAVKNALNADGVFSNMAVATSTGGVVTITYNSTTNIGTDPTSVAGGTVTTLAGAGANVSNGVQAVPEVTTVVLTDGTNTGLSKGDTMSLTVGGTVFTYTATGTTTMDTAAAALATQIQTGNSKVASATYNAGTDTLTITASASSAGAAGLSVSGYAITDFADVAPTADTLIGGKGDDVLTSNAAMSQLTGGEGNDVFIISAPSLNVNSYSTIKDFAAGDLIQMSGAISFAPAKVTLGGTAVFQDYANAAINSVGLNGAAWFQYGADTYIVMDKNTDTTAFVNGDDVIVRLTGTVDLANASFNSQYGTIALV